MEEHTCGDWTALQPVKIAAGETKCFTTTKNTQRCIMRYKVQINFHESYFLSNNKFSEEHGLQRNEVHLLQILCWQQGLPADLQGRRHLHCQIRWKSQTVGLVFWLNNFSYSLFFSFCGRQKNQLTDFLPAYSRKVMKVWYIPDENHKKFNSEPLRCCMTCSSS